MDAIKVVIRKDTGAIEITPELVEQALNYYFGMDASVTVFAAVEQSFAPDAEAVCICGDDLFAVNPDGKCAWCKLPRR